MEDLTVFQRIKITYMDNAIFHQCQDTSIIKFQRLSGRIKALGVGWRLMVVIVCVSFRMRSMISIIIRRRGCLVIRRRLIRTSRIKTSKSVTWTAVATQRPTGQQLSIPRAKCAQQPTVLNFTPDKTTQRSLTNLNLASTSSGATTSFSNKSPITHHIIMKRTRISRSGRWSKRLQALELNAMLWRKKMLFLSKR